MKFALYAKFVSLPRHHVGSGQLFGAFFVESFSGAGSRDLVD
jgi:hypothetical protein